MGLADGIRRHGFSQSTLARDGGRASVPAFPRKRGRPRLSQFIPGTAPENTLKRMNWLILIVAGLLEVGWAMGMKYSEGFTRLWPSVGTIAAIVVSLGLLAVSMKTIPAGTAYAVWAGIGMVGSVIAGVILMGDALGALRIASLVLILAGIVGLKLATPV